MIDPQRRSVLIGVRVWLIAVAVFVAAYLVWAVLAGALSSLLLLFTAILFAAGLRPIVRRLSARMPFGAAVGIAFGAVLLVAGAVAFVLIAPLGSEVSKLVEAVPGIVAELQQRLLVAQRFVKSDQLAQQVASAVANSAGGMVSTVGSQLLLGPALIAKIFGDLLLIVLLALGWMLSSDDLSAFFFSLFPPSAQKDWQDAIAIIGLRLTAYVQGVVINGAVVGVVTGAALAVLGVPYALLLGVIVGLLQAIPMVGAVISGLIVLVVALATVGWAKMLITLAVFAVVQIVDQNVLSPIIFGKRVQMSFLLIILSTVVGGALLGIPGAFLAVPAAVVVQVLIVEIIAPAIRRANGAST